MKVILMTLMILSAGFTGTAPLDSVDPSSASDDIRMEEPYNENTEASLLQDNAQKYEFSVSTNSEMKTYYISVDSTTTYEFAEGEVEVLVNGNPVEFSEEEHLGETWVAFETDNSDPIITVRPQAGGGTSGLYTTLKATFFDSPMTLVMGLIAFVTGLSILINSRLE